MSPAREHRAAAGTPASPGSGCLEVLPGSWAPSAQAVFPPSLGTTVVPTSWLPDAQQGTASQPGSPDCSECRGSNGGSQPSPCQALAHGLYICKGLYFPGSPRGRYSCYPHWTQETERWSGQPKVTQPGRGPIQSSCFLEILAAALRLLEDAVSAGGGPPSCPVLHRGDPSQQLLCHPCLPPCS